MGTLFIIKNCVVNCDMYGEISLLMEGDIDFKGNVYNDLLGSDLWLTSSEGLITTSDNFVEQGVYFADVSITFNTTEDSPNGARKSYTDINLTNIRQIITILTEGDLVERP